MKIAILTGYYDPEITAETHLLLNLANDFVKFNAEVIVITSFPTRGIDEKTRRKYKSVYEETTSNKVKILRVGVKLKEGNNFILRTLRYILISYAIYRAAKKIKPSVYLVTSTPPFLGIVGGFLSKIAPTVYNLQDLFPDSLITTKKSKENTFIFKLFRKLERYTYKNNNHILTISEDFKKSVLSKGVPEEKISIVYNWIDTNTVNPVNRIDNKLFNKYSLDPNSFYVTYCGNIGHTQNLEMVIDVAKRLENTIPDIRFVFIGDGAWRNNIIEYIKKQNSGNVKLLPFQPYESISSVYSLGDVSLVCSKKSVGINSLPSKTWSIMSAASAVLCSFDENSELCSIVNRADCGICVPPEDDVELENAIKFLYNDRKRTEKYGINGRQYVIKNLSRDYGTQAYFKVLKRFASDSN
jgi:glycosyltransferase involved in cell wall biosynthesis